MRVAQGQVSDIMRGQRNESGVHMHRSSRSIAALVVAAALGSAGIAPAASDGPTQITVEPAATLTAGDSAPFNAAGVKAIRRGKPIPAGYVLIGQTVTIKVGKVPAGASLDFTCPDRQRLQTFGTTGRAGFTATDRNYPNHRRTVVDSYAGNGTGTVYAVCR
jgi:hypothetical protein